MSLYGNIKKIDGSNFQFDRIYGNRKEMDSQASSDGVYAGRYVLVEYGERYNTNLSNTQAQHSIDYISKLRSELNRLKLQLLNENDKLNTLREIFEPLNIENNQVSQANYNLLLASFPIEYTLIEDIFSYNNEINYYIFENGIYRLFTGDTNQWEEAVNNRILYIRQKNFTEFFENFTGQNKILIATNTNIQNFHEFFSQKIAEKEEEIYNDFERKRNNIITPTGYEEEFSGIMIQENQEFIRNETIDLTSYGTTYDSTVWQKIYFKDEETGKSVDKYIMIAELNAIAPQFDVKVESPISYNVMQTNDINLDNDGVLIGATNQNNELDIIKLINVNENYNEAYFDSVKDTEQRFLMHYPQILKLEAGDNTINYNKKGFNIAYSYNEDDGDTGIVLSPDNITTNDYTKLYAQNSEGKIVEQTDLFGHKLALLKSDKDIDKKSLLMNFPTIGNTMKTLYDLIYGYPEGSEEDLEKGSLRPFFKKFAREIPFTNKITVLNRDNEEEYVRLKDRNNVLDFGTIVTVKSPIEVQDNDGNWQKSVIEKTFTWQELQGKTILPDFLQPRYRKINGDIIDMPSTEPTELGECILIDTLHGNTIVKWKMRFPTGDEDDGSTWADSAPTLQNLFQSNSTGLATILADLFSTSDPLTGQIKYYLYNDWTTEADGNNNTPAILNKPNTIGGYGTTFITYPNEGLADLSNGYYLNSSGRAVNKNTSNPVKQYSYTDIKFDSEIDEGHYQIDYNTWQLVSTADLNAKFDSIFSVSVSKIITPPSDNVIAKNNQEKINITQSNDKTHVNVYGNKNSIQKFTLNGLNRQWIGLDLYIGQYNANEIKINGSTLNDSDVANALASNLRPGHYAFWIDINNILVEQKIIVEVQGLESFEFYIQFFNQDINSVPTLMLNVAKLDVESLDINSGIYSDNQTIEACKFNQDKIAVKFESSNKKCTITGNIDVLEEYDPVNDNVNDIGKWIGLDISFSNSDIYTIADKVKVNGVVWTSEQQNEAFNFGLNEKHLIIWEKASNLVNGKSYQISMPDYNDYILIINFEDYRQMEFNIEKLETTILSNDEIIQKKSQYNQNLITIEKFAIANTFTIKGPIEEMRNFTIPNSDLGLGKWIYLVIQTDLSSIQGISLNDHVYTAAEETNFLNYGLPIGSILLQVNAQMIWDMNDHIIQLELKANKYEPVIFNLVFYNEASSLPNLNAEITKIDTLINDDNWQEILKNQNSVECQQSNNIITISGNIRSLDEFTRTNTNLRGRWIGIDINTHLENIEGIILNGQELTSEDSIEATQAGLPSGHILYWINLNEFPDDGYVVILEAEGYINTMLTFIFQQNNLEIENVFKISTINDIITYHDALINNQNNITINQDNNQEDLFIISGDYQALINCKINDEENIEKKYIGIAFEFNINNIIGVKNNDIEYTLEDATMGKNYYQLPTNISYMWYDVDELLREKQITFSKLGYAETEISLIFENTNKINIPITISKINIDENDTNINTSLINNQNKIEITIDNPNVASDEYSPHYQIQANESELEAYSLLENEEPQKWIGLDINTSFNSIDGIVFEGKILSQEDKDLAEEFNLPEGHIVYFVNINDIMLEQTITIKKLNYKDTNITLQFINNNFLNEEG